MNDDTDNSVIEVGHLTETNDNPLLFWVAYKRDGEKYNYLGDGKGNIRLFKTRQALADFLLSNVPDLVDVTIHSVIGKIALPEAENKTGALVPISTFAPYEGPPSSRELFQRIIETRKRHKSGNR